MVLILCLSLLWPHGLSINNLKVVAAATGKVTASSLNIRSGPGTSYDKVSVNGSYAYLKKDETFTILEEKDGWYSISFKFSGKTVEGYVIDDFVEVVSGEVATPTEAPKPTATPKPTEAPTPTPTPKAEDVNIKEAELEVPATVTASRLNVREKPTTSSSKVTTVTKNQKVTILNEVIVSTGKWYRISFQVNKKTTTGYVLSDYIKLTLSSKIKANVESSSKVKIRTGAGDTYKYLTKKDGSQVSLKDGKSITITKEVTDSKGQKWFKISFTLSSVKYSGYILADKTLIRVTTTPTATPTKAPTDTPTVTPTDTPTVTPTETPNVTPTAKVTATPKPSAEPTQAVTPTVTPKPGTTVTPKPGTTVTPTPTPNATPAVTKAPTSTPKSSPTPTPFGYIKEVTTPTEGSVYYASLINVFQNVMVSNDVLFDENYNPILLASGDKVTVSHTVYVNSVPWYVVSFSKNDKSYAGYVKAEYILLGELSGDVTIPVTPSVSVTPTPMPSTGILTDAEFEQSMSNQGFPESYKYYLRELHKLYPTWVFEAYHTGLDWNTVISKEGALGINLITNNKSLEWKSFAKGAYNWKTDRFIPFDGSTWVTASKVAIEYFMDPRNFLNEKGIFQFELLTYKSQYQNATGVEGILFNTALYNKRYSFVDDNGKTKDYTFSETFIKAAEYSGVSPFHLATRVKQEVVTGPTTLSSSVSGTVEGLEGLYNFYNIGAYHSTAPGGAIANGLKYAKNGTTSSDLNALYLIPWDNPFDSIVGGAYIIGRNYINRGQNTIYLQKFNVTPTSTYSHQYMANVEAPNAEAKKTYTAYSGMMNVPIVFSIPVYNNMPSKASPVPTKMLNPNNWLKTLKVNGLSLTPTFDLSKDQPYSLIIENSMDFIDISATAVSSKSTVMGTGIIPLIVGSNEVVITVMAENGNIREYIIYVVREEE
jgi:beta-N-acetylglucosaminidase/uncharacterized protein YgiM (DUF1202 family)